MPVHEFKEKRPKIHPSVFVAETATIIGDVEIGVDCSIWPGVVIRGDVEQIKIGDKTNVQDNTVIHPTTKHPVIIGEKVTIAHGCIVHGCQIGSNCLIGNGAMILDGAEIGNDCIVGAGAVVTEGQKIPKGSVAIGVPAKVLRKVSEEDLKRVDRGSAAYIKLARGYKKS